MRPDAIQADLVEAGLTTRVFLGLLGLELRFSHKLGVARLQLPPSSGAFVPALCDRVTEFVSSFTLSRQSIPESSLCATIAGPAHRLVKCGRWR